MKIIDAQIHIWSQTVTPPSGLHRSVEHSPGVPVYADIVGLKFGW